MEQQQTSKSPFVLAAALAVAAFLLQLVGAGNTAAAVAGQVAWTVAFVAALVGLIRLADGVDYLARRERERQRAEDGAYVRGLSRAANPAPPADRRNDRD
ncbi:hypothetical protein [Cellulomonas massiliensis]|uniref:hypothetical protein n=1 Tax=Cellulomonas massiliensis TaxID=1465811 RepID=UPI0002DF1F58|nr:hypothetical protein [Cellulomonas massiliensis]